MRMMTNQIGGMTMKMKMTGMIGIKTMNQTQIISRETVALKLKWSISLETGGTVHMSMSS